MKRIPPEGVLDWLVARESPLAQAQGQEFAKEAAAILEELGANVVEGRGPQLASYTGLDGVGWDADAWILHAMYEMQEHATETTYDDIDRVEGRPSLSRLPDDMHEVFSESTLTGVVGGLTGWPGSKWTRLRWRDLLTLLNTEPPAEERYPSDQWFPFSSWPVSIAPPGEGSLDREQFLRLLEHLAVASRDGWECTCFAYYATGASGEWDEDVVYDGRLADLASLIERDDLRATPSNIWPADRSWLVYTDYDLWATKLSGSAHLIERLEADPELEMMRLT